MLRRGVQGNERKPVIGARDLLGARDSVIGLN